MLYRFFIIAALMASLTACDESDAKGIPFTTSECKANYVVPKTIPKLLTLETSDMYQGFNCISWALQDDLLNVDLINFSGSCASYDMAQSTSDENVLAVNIINTTCMVAMCGSCEYDWSVQVEPPTHPTTLVVNRDACPTDEIAPSAYALTANISLDENTSGITCDYKYIEWQSLADCGTLHSPCFILEDDTDNSVGNPDCGTSERRCLEGMVCFQDTQIQTSRCIAECQGDADCPLPEILSCQSGLCLLR